MKFCETMRRITIRWEDEELSPTTTLKASMPFRRYCIVYMDHLVHNMSVGFGMDVQRQKLHVVVLVVVGL
jgi:hypothetical protein